ncbi:MAG: hypothetical protein KDC05_01925 [Bacteroidales bacterium]|nr:hypothetical protein [Bacteroidales bacterium]
MKKIFIVITVLLSIVRVLFANGNISTSMVQETESSSASIGGGVLILLSLGLGYSIRRIHDIRSQNRELAD